MNVWILFAIYAALALLSLGVFLWGRPDGNSPFDRLYRLIRLQIPRWIKLALRKCCGKRGPAALDAAWNYVCNQSNPLVQIFYLGVITGGFSAFVLHGYPYIPNRFAGDWHKYNGFGVYCICIWVWWQASRVNPGIVTRENVDELCEVFKWDNMIFFKADCHTCKLAKPARSKHCALCDVCVAKFDHHCIWINNCVGAANHKWFLAFLFWHLVLCLYGFTMGSLILWDITVRKDLLNAVFIEPVTRVRTKATYSIVFQYLIATEPFVIFIALLCGVMGILVFGFFLYHLNLVRVGNTTNEQSKWGYARWLLRQEGEEGKEKLAQLRNSYNKGCASNFREVFFPLDTDSLGLAAKATLDEGCGGAATQARGKGAVEAKPAPRAGKRKR